jgi:serine/threonine-protein kinase
VNPPDPGELAVLAALLDQALDLEADDRAAWLDRLRCRDPRRAAAVEDALAREPELQEQDFLERSPAVALQGGAQTLAGMNVGPYTLSEPLGHGGMGSVWLAARSDGRFEGEVAVKLLNPARLQGVSAERFRREGNVLARLTHPGIARLVDAGIAAGGVPYLVLERVRGSRIDVYCDSYRLTPEQRLELISQVLDAVAHAHARMVVHRDLKPSNILVTDDGAVKLLDFGIAKLLDAGSEEGDLTEAGGMPFTPEYAAPEQIAGDPVTAATDVYALGVLLHVLLSGSHPTGAGGTSTAERIRAVMEREPARLRAALSAGGEQNRPSLEAAAALRGSTVERLRRLYSGDLENIVAKALEKDPGRRYPTAAALAEDLRRYRRHEPVAARTPSVGYRFRKFVRRNRIVVGAGGLAFLTLVAATVLTSAQMLSARQQRDLAQAERDRAVFAERRATASSGFMDLLLQQINDEGPLDVVEEARTLLERDYREDPRFVARMLVELSTHYYRVRDRSRQFALLERADQLATESADEETVAHANCWLGMTLAFDGELAPARQRLARASQALDQIGSPPLPVTIRCLQARSNLARAEGLTDSALALARAAVQLSNSAGLAGSYEHQFVLNELAGALTTAGRFREALDVTRQSQELLSRVGRGSTMTMLVERYNAAAFLNDLGEFRAADSALRVSIDPLTATHGVPTYITSLAGWLAGELGQSDSSIRSLERARDEARRQGDLPGQARSVSRLVHVLIAHSRLPEAEREIATLEALTSDTADAQLLLRRAELHAARSEWNEAQRGFAIALDAMGYPGRVAGVRDYPAAVVAASEVALKAGQPASADSLARQALQLASAEGHDVQRSGVVGRALVAQASARLALGDASGGAELLRRAQAPLMAAYGPVPTNALRR